MPNPRNLGSFQRAFDLLEKASMADRGILYRTKNISLAYKLKMECESVRTNSRRESKQIYPRGHPLYDRSPYDGLKIVAHEDGLSLFKAAPDTSRSFAIEVMNHVLETGQPQELVFETEEEALRFRRKCYKIRNVSRKHSTEDPQDPLFGRSKFDSISIRVSGSEVVIESGLFDSENIEEL